MLFGARLVVGFDASCVSGTVVSSKARAVAGSGMVEVPLSPGSLVPSVLEDNLVRPEEVREALAALYKRLGGDGRRTCLVLPDGVARVGVVDAPEGVEPLEYARFRIVQGLPFPASEAIVDGVPSGPARCVAAAVRRRVVRAYEEAAALAGFQQERVELAPFAALLALERGRGNAGDAVAVILSDTAYSLAVLRGANVVAFRSRRRDPGAGEEQRLREEIDRTAALNGVGAASRVLAVGRGSARLIASLRSAGRDASPGWGEAEGEGASAAWVGAALT